MSDHTPGPWAMGEHGHASVVSADSGNWIVADVFGARSTRLANARLIAAAPDLARALRDINMLACYASEEDTESREDVLLKIGEASRAALKAAGVE